MRLLVVGGGPAGCAAALFAAQKGHRVTLAEMKTGPIDKPCGEGLLPFGCDILRELDPQLENQIRQAGQPFGGILYRHQNQAVSGHFPAGRFGVGIARHQLDRILQAALEHKAIQVRRGWKVDRAQMADWDQVILACGNRAAAFRDQIGSFCKSSRLGLRLRLRTTPGDRVEVHFLPFGEVYFTPVAPAELSVAMLMRPEQLPGSGSFKDQCIAQFRTHFPQYASLELQDVASYGPIACRWKGASPSPLRVGDSYRAFDPISGAGMSFALLSAKIAVQHLGDPDHYAAALRPHVRHIAAFTNLLLFLSKKGWRRNLMMHQIAKMPRLFSYLLNKHANYQA